MLSHKGLRSERSSRVELTRGAQQTKLAATVYEIAGSVAGGREHFHQMPSGKAATSPLQADHTNKASWFCVIWLEIRGSWCRDVGFHGFQLTQVLKNLVMSSCMLPTSPGLNWGIAVQLDFC